MILFNINKKQKEQKNQYNNEVITKINMCKSLYRPFNLKSSYNSIIPLKTFTCWHTKDLPQLMKDNYQKFVKIHSSFENFFYDEKECDTFIRENFEDYVYKAYNILIPSAYKSDLWRYCVLYKNGGIYFDIKFMCVNNFNLIALTDKEYFVRDREPWGGTANGLISVKPGNEIMLKCIRQIVVNVRNKYYGKNALEPSGPNLLGKYFTNEEKQKMELRFENINIQNLLDEWVIIFNNTIILRQYNNYRKEQTKKHYSELWNERNIYI
jgi:mannosyltransferase OCH1-like enzyme